MKCGGTKNATGSVSEGGKLSGDELSRMEQDKEVGGAPPDRWTGGRAVLAVRGRVQGWGSPHFSFCRAQALGTPASAVATLRLRSCSAWAFRTPGLQ